MHCQSGTRAGAGAPWSGDGGAEAGPAALEARNAGVLLGMRDGVSRRFALTWRPAACVAALDAGFLCGDGVAEDFHAAHGCVLFLWVRAPPAGVRRGVCPACACAQHTHACRRTCGGCTRASRR
jgi:hypothetical protein